jgi:hypothetical protein
VFLRISTVHHCNRKIRYPQLNSSPHIHNLFFYDEFQYYIPNYFLFLKWYLPLKFHTHFVPHVWCQPMYRTSYPSCFNKLHSISYVRSNNDFPIMQLSPFLSLLLSVVIHLIILTQITPLPIIAVRWETTEFYKHTKLFFCGAKPVTSQDHVTVEVSWSRARTHTPNRTPLNEWSARRTGSYLNTRNEHPCCQRDSNPLSQQPIGRRTTP